MGKQHFTMLAHTYEGLKRNFKGYWWSHKLDGMRAIWDGGISRGRTDWPWAKGERATGLWTRNGKVIRAPEDYLDHLPEDVMADGELWSGLGAFRNAISVCRSHNAGDRWDAIKYMCFDLPAPAHMFNFRTIDDPQCKMKITLQDACMIQKICKERGMEWYSGKGWNPALYEENRPLVWGAENDVFQLLNHYPVEGDTKEEQHEFITDLMNRVVSEGHEGICMRRAGSLWCPVRSHDLYKLKPYITDEATVIGTQFGRDTEKGGRLLGMMGALICDWHGRKIRFSGFDDCDRELATDAIREHAIAYEGQESMLIFPVAFPAGTVVTFKYREKTPDGMPCNPRYVCKRDYE